MRILSVFFILFFTLWGFSVFGAEITHTRNPYTMLLDFLPDIDQKEPYIGLSLGSYKPNLMQINALMKDLGIPAPGADTMFTIFADFRGTSQFSYLLQGGYWEGETSLKVPVKRSLYASLIHISFNILYHPERFQKFLPLYIGTGFGIYRMDLDGSLMEVLKDVIPEDKATELGGNIVLGLERVLRNRFIVSVRANHIFKNFTIDEKNKSKLSFDGTDVSIGTSVRF